ncbi:macrosialin [Alligator mississippiensis]|uniref:Macrosialin n=1 Tax=Alligator mississippiensis TaxID=8496 RepID=A0A151P6V8_ALLMI|nr:macrosialin [Alligator mississippiensis]
MTQASGVQERETEARDKQQAAENPGDDRTGMGGRTGTVRTPAWILIALCLARAVVCFTAGRQDGPPPSEVARGWERPRLLGPMPGPGLECKDCAWPWPWPWKKSATLAPAFTKTPTPHPSNRTTTPHPSNHTTTPHPSNHTTTPHPSNHTTTPHPSNHTTPHPSNHTTTPHPSNHTTTPHPSNHTTLPTRVPPTLQPTAIPGVPLGDYRVDNGSGPCLRLEAGLQLRVRYAAQAKHQLWGTFTVMPNCTKASGWCHKDIAVMNLTFPEGFLQFTFHQNQTRGIFYLSGVKTSLTVQFPEATEGHFRADNASLRDLEAALGHCYACSNRSLVLSATLRLDALQERAQAFTLPQGGAFGDAVHCPADHSLVVPIVVAVVLIVLILIVIIAYLVGRHRRRGGYQPL